MRNAALLAKLGQTEMPFFGYNASGLPLGDDDGFRDKRPDEDLNGKHDALIVVGPELLQRSIYHVQGFTNDPRMFLREPARDQMVEYDFLLRRHLGWTVRLCDTFRDWTIQRKGFCWGVSEIVRNRSREGGMDALISDLKTALNGGAIATDLEDIFTGGNRFFSYVKPLAYDQQFPSGVTPLMVTAAANLGVLDLPLNKYGLMAHNTGGVVDVEWLDENGKLINVGVPVDTQGVEAAFPFFEPRVATILKPELEAAGVGEDIESRQRYFRKMVAEKPLIAKFQADCGVDVQELLTSDTYLAQVWNEIMVNSRAVCNLGTAAGIFWYGLEKWHGDCDDARGGVRSNAKKVVSGAGGMAVYKGQDECAWGCAMQLWERLVAA